MGHIRYSSSPKPWMNPSLPSDSTDGAGDGSRAPGCWLPCLRRELNGQLLQWAQWNLQKAPARVSSSISPVWLATGFVFDPEDTNTKSVDISIANCLLTKKSKCQDSYGLTVSSLLNLLGSDFRPVDMSSPARHFFSPYKHGSDPSHAATLFTCGEGGNPLNIMENF